jgi:hypothetical protein
MKQFLTLMITVGFGCYGRIQRPSKLNTRRSILGRDRKRSRFAETGGLSKAFLMSPEREYLPDRIYAFGQYTCP